MKISPKQLAQAFCNQTQEKIEDVLVILEAIKDNNEVTKKLLINPQISLKEKKDKLTELGVMPDIVNLLLILVQNKLISKLDQIIYQIKKINEQKNKLAEFNVISPVLLSDSELSKIKEKLVQATNKSIVLTDIIDQSIMGGIIIKSEDTIMDLSLKNKILQMKSALTK